ncbi:MAG: aromatic amino acid lyase [Candidatus Limnocylindrales bacterium]
MTVVLTGSDLTRMDVVRVARSGTPVRLAPAAVERMAAARTVVDHALARQDPVYGLTTAVGVLKRVAVDAGSAGELSRRIIRHHLVGQGPSAPPDVVRATILRLANGFASGIVGVRPELAERLVAALEDGRTPIVRILGSVGQADLSQMADIAIALFADVELAPGEGLALVSSNSFSTGWAALAVTDALDLLDAMTTAGAMSLEALAANPSMLHPAIARVRPYPGLRTELDRLRMLLAGSFIWEDARARSLQDPLTFRNLPHILGACRDVSTHVEGQLAIELNASQGNPIVVMDEDRLVSVANHEILPLVLATDHLRTALASAISASSERTVKLLETPWSGLPTGLVATSDGAEPGLAYLGIASQALAAEARSIATPVSHDLVSTAHAEGIEDRTTMAPLSVRRLAEMADLGRRVVAIELAVAAQATELRAIGPRGIGTGRAAAVIRDVVPYLTAERTVPDLQPLVAIVAGGAFAPERLAR